MVFSFIQRFSFIWRKFNPSFGGKSIPDLAKNRSLIWRKIIPPFGGKASPHLSGNLLWWMRNHNFFDRYSSP
jgi:hypothetical protein